MIARSLRFAPGCLGARRGRARAGLIAAALLASGGLAAAQPSAQLDAAAAVAEAQAALVAGDHQRAARLSGPVAGSAADLPRQDRAEALRVYGLALFFLDRHREAEAALLDYLKLDVEAHLDPTLVPPEAIVFFEDVRSRHAAELRAYRPRAAQKRSAWLNLVPPAGQFQNGDRTKGWIIAGAGGALVAANLTSFLVLKRWCRSDDLTCSGRPERAETLRAVNLVTAAAAGGLYVYAVIDGMAGHRRLGRQEWAEGAPMSVGVAPSREGLVLSISGRF